MIDWLFIIVSLFFAVVILLSYVDVDDTYEGLPVMSPRYGGVPVVLNQMLAEARANGGDTDTESKVHTLRKRFFRNRRTASEAEATDIEARRKFIAKYPKTGELALKYDDTRRKMAALTSEQNDALIKEILAEAALPPPPDAKKVKQ